MAVPATVAAVALVLAVAAAMAVEVEWQLFEATAFLLHLLVAVDFENRFTDATHLDRQRLYPTFCSKSTCEEQRDQNPFQNCLR